MKKWLNRYEHISLTWDHSPAMMKLELDIADQKWRIKTLKELKKAMQKDII